MREMRQFETGATRDSDDDKLDFEGFYHPLVMIRFAEYMHKHRLQADGKLRDSDNWQKGIPKTAYIKSMFRHFVDLWLEHRGLPSREGIIDALCGIIFNAQGYLLELLMEQRNQGHVAVGDMGDVFGTLYDAPEPTGDEQCASPR